MHWPLLLIFAIFCSINAIPFGQQRNREVCNSNECLEISQYLKNAMNSSVNPCDNFYQFACGRYIEEAVIPPSATKLDLLTELSLKLQSDLDQILTQNIGNADTKATELVSELYRTCLNSYGDIKLTVETIKNLLPEIGGWLVLEDNNSSLSWPNVSYTARALGINANSFMPIVIRYSLYNTTEYDLILNVPDFLISQSFLLQGLNNINVKVYENTINYFARILGATDLEYTRAEIRKLVEFEIELARIALPIAPILVSIDELEKSLKNIPWSTYISQMMRVENWKPSKNELVQAVSSYYLIGLNHLIENTDPKVLTSYIQFRAIENVLNLGGVSLLKRIERIPSLDLLERIVKPREYDLRYPGVCNEITRVSLTQAVSSMYARKYMNSAIKNDIANMVNKFKETFISIIEENNWFDEETKNNAMRKVIAMGVHSAYPDELFDDAVLNEYYKNVNVDKNFIKLQLNIQKSNFDTYFEKYTLEVNKSHWSTHSGIAEVNAYYTPLENALQILAGIIHNPMYRVNNPNFANFATIGSVIGHEINHGFDTSGSQFDELGQLSNWFTEESLQEYNDRVECLYNMYLSVTKNATTSQRTINEDIADSGGVSLAYTSYQEWLASNQAENPLPGLDYNPNQLFWIFYSRLWCSKETDYFLENIAPIDVHSLGRYRGLVPLMNSADFAKDFNCPVGSYMNPANKCKVW